MVTSGRLLAFYLSLMAMLLGAALLFPAQFTSLLKHPELYLHVKFLHILSVTLFFANTVIGTIWEVRSLQTKRPEIIEHTYKTVTWLDGVFTAPLILVAVLSGITLATILGGIWSSGWLSAAFLLFLLSGLVWVTADLPNQHRVNHLFKTLPTGTKSLPPELTRLLWWRMAVNFFGFAPLLVIFFLMIHKPEIPAFFSFLARP
jgi:uncharacterized membrane protein